MHTTIITIQYCGHFFDFERIFVRLKFVSDYLSTRYKFQYIYALKPLFINGLQKVSTVLYREQ